MSLDQLHIQLERQENTAEGLALAESCKARPAIVCPISASAIQERDKVAKFLEEALVQSGVSDGDGGINRNHQKQPTTEISIIPDEIVGQVVDGLKSNADHIESISGIIDDNDKESQRKAEVDLILKNKSVEQAMLTGLQIMFNKGKKIDPENSIFENIVLYFKDGNIFLGGSMTNSEDFLEYGTNRLYRFNFPDNFKVGDLSRLENWTFDHGIKYRIMSDEEFSDRFLKFIKTVEELSLKEFFDSLGANDEQRTFYKLGNMNELHNLLIIKM